jgi:hypothetical protein
MPPTEFPTVSLSASNPWPNVFYQMITEYNVESTEYDDKGRDFALQSGGVGVLRWYLLFKGKSLTQIAILDSHAESARLGPDGLSAYSFDFRDRDTGVLYTGVRYERYERVAHVYRGNQSRIIILARFP